MARMEKIKKKRGKRRLFIAGIIFVILLALLLSYKVFSSSTPQIISASVYPAKVQPGDVMLITVAMKGNINSVVAENTHDKGSDKINLHLKEIKNNTKIYAGSWIVHDTTGQFPYRTYITVTGKLGKTASEQVEWLDPTVSHKASEMVGGGTFGSGNYTFPEDLRINRTAILKRLNSTPSNETGYGKIYYKLGGDAIDSSTKLLLHADGTDGSTTFTDSSSSGYTVLINGDVQIDTEYKKFGTASGLFDGYCDYLNVSDNADWYWDGDFTVDFWARFVLAAGSDSDEIFSQGTDGSNYHRFYWRQDVPMWKYGKAGGTETEFIAPDTVSADTWYHVALVRSSNDWYIFKDGVQINKTTDSVSLVDYTGVFGIGTLNYGIGTYCTQTSLLNGSLDEFRVSKGIARWTSNFTVPSLAYGTAGGLIFQFQNGTEYTLAGA